ncbi:response regulator transcription factor [Terrimonas sp. NA20]|uniref:Response regulator transcription factor n=1 Tax=Terrimonas ginsenosidimutans TaxID=2908004 RepID=A0ABS9KPE6_9BACT|nr:response regulator transcription factor [Terrimonas ginsenosidimutans]MCG2614187.1 response regulator transcription factor [Terrimonas ginsenosidimutans]
MEPQERIIRVALVDDHVLLRNALTILINSFENCRVVNESSNGKEIKEAIESGIVPDLIIMDLNMPVMDGFEAAEYLHTAHPQLPILMLTMYDSELSLIRLLQTGVKGFLKKDIHPAELKFAIRSVVNSGFYYSNHTTGKLINLFRSNTEGQIPLEKSLLTTQELQFMQMICSDLTYKEVAQKMGLNPRSVDTLRDQLFIKLDVKSRVGLAMLAIRHGIVTF